MFDHFCHGNPHVLHFLGIITHIILYIYVYMYPYILRPQNLHFCRFWGPRAGGAVEYFIYVHPYLGEMIPIDEHFSNGLVQLPTMKSSPLEIDALK